MGVMGRTCLAAASSVGVRQWFRSTPALPSHRVSWNAPAPWLDKYLSLPAKIFVVGL